MNYLNDTKKTQQSEKYNCGGGLLNMSRYDLCKTVFGRSRFVISAILTLVLGIVTSQKTYADVDYSITFHDGIVTNMPSDVNSKTYATSVSISPNTL